MTLEQNQRVSQLVSGIGELGLREFTAAFCLRVQSRIHISYRHGGKPSGLTVSIDSLSPNQAPPGWTDNMTITGFDFDPVMPVSFLNGSSNPIVSNVQFLDPTTIQATVKVTGKKRLKDPVLDDRRFLTQAGRRK